MEKSGPSWNLETICCGLTLPETTMEVEHFFSPLKKETRPLRWLFRVASPFFGPTSHVALRLNLWSFDLQVMQRVSFSLTALDLRMVRQGYFLEGAVQQPARKKHSQIWWKLSGSSSQIGNVFSHQNVSGDCELYPCLIQDSVCLTPRLRESILSKERKGWVKPC